MTDTAAIKKKGPTLLETFRAFNDRRMAATFILSLAAGIPRSAILGVLIAWLSQEGVNTKTIGIFSLVTIGYAFKYLWAPLFQRARDIPLIRLGGRRSWLALCQIIIAALIVLLAVSNPAQNMGLVALLALVITLLGPTYDLILDAWRIEVARDEQDLDLMAAMYQFGYKAGGLLSGFLALITAAWFGWPTAFILLGVVMGLTTIGTLLAPEPESSARPDTTRVSFQPSLPSSITRPAVMFVALCWVVALYLISSFIIDALVLNKDVSGGGFVKVRGPIIVILTIVVPAVSAAILLFRYNGNASETPTELANATRTDKITATMFRAIFDPMMDLVFRLRWWTILVIALALTYRFTDAVWGIFAYPFYLRADLDALGHTTTDVAIASKFFGVIATILGSGLGAVLIVRFGRMPIMLAGGIVAAATNLIYADLAAGAAGMDAFLSFTNLDVPLIAFAEWASTLNPDYGTLGEDQGRRLARLMMTIFAENIAGGLALVAMTAYLTSVVNPRFAAVQYALLASMTLLIGTLGQAWLGEIINANGFYDVFIITFWLGGVAVVLTIIEWMRQSRSASPMGLDKDTAA